MRERLAAALLCLCLLFILLPATAFAENIGTPLAQSALCEHNPQHNEAIYYAIDIIQTAIHNQRTISFQYYEYSQNKERVLRHNGYRYVVSPYTLIRNRAFYYVVGWSEKHGKLAQFRVDRMTAIANDEAAYIEDASFDPAVYLREVFGMYHDDSRQVTLLCENSIMRSVIPLYLLPNEMHALQTMKTKLLRMEVQLLTAQRNDP